MKLSRKRRSLNCNCFILLYICKHCRFLHTPRSPPWQSWSPPTQWFNAKTQIAFKQLVLILGRILHFFTMFGQCFNGHQFWWRLVINAIIMNGPGDGVGGGGGGGDWMEINILHSFSLALSYCPNHEFLMQPLFAYLKSKNEKVEKKILTLILNSGQLWVVLSVWRWDCLLTNTISQLYFSTLYTATKSPFTLLEITIGQDKIYGWSAQNILFTFYLVGTVALVNENVPVPAMCLQSKISEKTKNFNC